MRPFFTAFTALLAGMLAFVAPAAGEEGMWTFDNIPAAQMRTVLGWAPDQPWLDRVMGATARIPGCSAAVVSGQGLVLTNHHCVIACIQNASAAALEQGFVARVREEERRCPGASVQVLLGITDVTHRIAAATAHATPATFAQARDAEIARIRGECGEGERCELQTLYRGARYAIYRYRRYDDVRLVFAPERAIAAFGGDADNFSFPRFGFDVAFLRAYQNGAPAVTPTHLPMRFTPLSEREVVLVAGNPGATQRLRSTAELAFERDMELPWQIASLQQAEARLAAYARQGEAQAASAFATQQAIINAVKALEGRLQALHDVAAFARLTAAETDLQQRIHRNVGLQRDVGDAWGDIAYAESLYRDFYFTYQYLELRAGERSALFGWARDLVRAAAERQKPDGERLTRYTSARLPAVAASVVNDQTVDPGLEAVNLELWLSGLRDHVDGQAAAHVLGAEAPAALAARLAQSQLADPAFRRALWEGGPAAVEASDDPMIVFVRSWDANARAVRARHEQEVATPVALAQERIAAARFRISGLTEYPEATFSPRLTYGRAEGWSEGGRAVPAFTTFSGLFRHARGPDYVLPQRWRAAQARVGGDVILDMSSSNDVSGGNSGSALIDRSGAVVGVVFDGNMHSLGGEYFYDESVNRSISVSSTAIETALRDVYGMDALLAELSAP